MLSPPMFIVYVSDLPAIVNSDYVTYYNMYVDDLAIHIGCKHSDLVNGQVNSCNSVSND